MVPQGQRFKAGGEGKAERPRVEGGPFQPPADLYIEFGNARMILNNF